MSKQDKVRVERTAQEALSEHVETCRELLAKLSADFQLCAEIARPSWGDVRDVAHVEDMLLEIIKFWSGEGE